MQTSGVQNKSTVSIRHLRCSLLLSRWCLDILCHSSSHGRRGSLWSLSLPLIVLWVWRLLMCSLPPPPPIPPPEDQCSVWRKERRKDRHCRSGRRWQRHEGEIQEGRHAGTHKSRKSEEKKMSKSQSGCQCRDVQYFRHRCKISSWGPWKRVLITFMGAYIL